MKELGCQGVVVRKYEKNEYGRKRAVGVSDQEESDVQMSSSAC